MKKLLIAMLAMPLLALVSLPAAATPVSLNTWYGFAFTGPSTPLVRGYDLGAPTNPAGITAPDPAWTFTLPTAGTLTVVDLFQSTDQFTMFDFASLLGTTSTPTEIRQCLTDVTCALADDAFSRGVFNLSAGAHSITGTQSMGTSGSGAFRVDASRIAVPAPDSALLLFLLGLGLVGSTLILRRTRGDT